MNRIVRTKQKGYTTISNAPLRDKRLSLKAKGFLALVMALPDDWDFTIHGITLVIKEGESAIKTIINELKECGYCTVTKCRNEKGVITGSDWVFYETPQENHPYVENPHVDNPHVEDPHVENRTQLNKDITKTMNEQKKKLEKRSRTEYSDDFEEAFKLTGRKGVKKIAYERWKKLSDEDKKKAMIHIRFYYQSNERQYLKNFEGYLNQRYFDNAVYDRWGRVLYDPERNVLNEYRPDTDGKISWSERLGKYIFFGMFESEICDGYTPETRPDGAELMFNNTHVVVAWNRNAGQWVRL